MTTRRALALEYFHPWPNSAGFYVARHHGWYADAGIELQIRTLESSGIGTLAELAGRRLALNPTPRGLAMVRDLVRRAGGQPDEVVLVDVGARELTSDELAAGAADATFGSYWAWDILLSEHPDRPERVWRVDDELPFSYHSYLLGARADFAAAQPNLLDAFHDATDRGFRYAAEYPVETVEVLRGVTPYFTDHVITRSLEAISGTWFHDGHWGTIRRELVEPYAHWLAEHGILSTPERWQEAVLDASAAGAGTAT